MPTEILQKTREPILAQDDSAGLTADQDPNSGSYTNGSAVTTIDNTINDGTENAKGAYLLDLELNVTSSPTGAAVAKIYCRTSKTGSGDWTRWQYSHTVPASILTTADRYRGGLFLLTANFTELAVMAEGYDFAAELYATPILPGEAQ